MRMKKIITLMIVTSILISCWLDNKETIKEKAINITKKEINNNTWTTNTESEAELETEVNDLLDEFIDSLDNYEK